MMKKKILLVDDEDDLREVLKFLLESDGYHIIEAKNGAEGLLTSKQDKPDLIISDIRMPEMDGLQLLEALNKLGMPCPVILLTGFADVTSIRTAWRLGAFDFLDKPISEKTLLETVHRALVFGKKNNIPA